MLTFKKSIFLILLSVIVSSIAAQNTNNNSHLQTVKMIADVVLQDATYLYYDNSTDEQVSDIREYGYNTNVILQSEYNRWHYANGVLHMAFNELGNVTDMSRYQDFTKKNFEFFFNDLSYFEPLYPGKYKWRFPLGQAIVTEELDDCGAVGASLIELYQTDKREDYKKYIDKAADHIMNKQMRLEDGTFARPRPHRKTVWADDLYMSVPFLARMGELTGQDKYFNEAAKQVILFNQYLYDENSNLMWHCYYDDLKTTGGTFWGRCNGWMIVATADLLRFLPENHKDRATIIELLNRQIRGIAQYQSPVGLWYQVLHKPDSYLETSCSAMFTYSVALAINNGWVDKRYKTMALAGWEGINTHITKKGNVNNICVGTGIGNDILFYYERPAETNDFHGMGIVMLAGIEISKFEDQ